MGITLAELEDLIEEADKEGIDVDELHERKQNEAEDSSDAEEEKKEDPKNAA